MFGFYGFGFHPPLLFYKIFFPIFFYIYIIYGEELKQIKKYKNERETLSISSLKIFKTTSGNSFKICNSCGKKKPLRVIRPFSFKNKFRSYTAITLNQISVSNFLKKESYYFSYKAKASIFKTYLSKKSNLGFSRLKRGKQL